MRGNTTVLLRLLGAVLLLPVLTQARNASVSIFYTGDICGSLNRSWDDTRCGGVVPCASVIQRKRAACSGGVLIDGGNFFGSGFDSQYCSTEKLSASMSAMGYDAWLPGWRDWCLGLSELDRISDVPILAANVSLHGKRCRSHIIREVDGINVAIIGLVDPSVSRTASKERCQNIGLDDCVDSLARVMPVIRDKDPAVIVLVLDSGVRNNAADLAMTRRVVRCFPEIDVVLTKGSRQSRRIGTAQHVSVPVDSACVGQIVLTYDTTERILSEAGVHWLNPSCNTFSRGHLLYDVIGAEVAAAQKGAESVVGSLPEQISGTNGESGESAIGRLLGTAVAEELECDAVFFRWPVGPSLGPGPIRARDVRAAYPDYCTWAILRLTPEELKQVVGEGIVQQFGTDLQLGCHGFTYERDERGQLSGLRLPTGEHMHPRKRYRVACPQSVVASYGGLYPNLRALSSDPLTRCELTDVDIYDAVINYISRHYN